MPVFEFEFEDDVGCHHNASVVLDANDVSGADRDDVLDHIHDKIKEAMEDAMIDDAPYGTSDISERDELEDEIKQWMDDKRIPFGAGRPRKKRWKKKKARKKKKTSGRYLLHDPASIADRMKKVYDDEPAAQQPESDEKKRMIDFFKGKDEPRGPSGGLFGIPRSLATRRRRRR